VSNVRGLGLILAMDLPDAGTRDAVRTGCWERGLAALACGTHSLRFRPPLIFSRDDVDKAVGILRRVLDDVLSTVPSGSVA
jgi:L-lysine 6-transaminase